MQVKVNDRFKQSNFGVSGALMISLVPDIETLTRHLAYHCATPQPAERWAMYRLITPVVDFACLRTGWQPFFEYNQTSKHKTSQSVDIALLHEGAPRMLVEAKRAMRPISRQQIDKYLEPGLPGIVSNGADWILCRNADSHHVRIWDDAEQQVSQPDLMRVVRFITGETLGGKTIDLETEIAPVLRPDRPTKAVKAQRKSHTVESIGSEDTLLAFAAQNAKLTTLDRVFLEAFAGSLARMPENIKIEARETRMSVWDASTGKKVRLMRIEFGKRQPSLIIKTAIVNTQTELDLNVVHYRHDKHGGMREFRLTDTRLAQSLGQKIATLLTIGSRFDA